jgi:hypothetical protein
MVNDLGAAVNRTLVVLGDRLGIYAALADAGLATSQQLAKKTKLHERQLREWLSAQAASGYVSYDAASDACFLMAEQIAVFADPNSPAAMTGGFYAISAIHHGEPLVAESLRTGAGLPWGKRHNCILGAGIARQRRKLNVRVRLSLSASSTRSIGSRKPYHLSAATWPPAQN